MYKIPYIPTPEETEEVIAKMPVARKHIAEYGDKVMAEYKKLPWWKKLITYFGGTSLGSEMLYVKNCIEDYEDIEYALEHPRQYCIDDADIRFIDRWYDKGLDL